MYFLIGAVLLFALQTVATKVYQSHTELNRFFTSVFLAGIGLILSILFLCVTGFKPEINYTSISFALIYAISFIVCQYGYIGAIENGKMAIATIFLMSGAIVIPFVWGALFLNEEVGSAKIVGFILMIASLLPLLKNVEKKKANVKFILYCLLVFVGNGVLNVVVATQAKGEMAVGAPDFMFQGCLFYFIVGVIGVIIFALRNKNLEADLKRLNCKQVYFSILGLALANGLGNTCSLLAAKSVDSTVQFPTMNGGVLIMAGLFSYLFFKEKLSKKDMASFILIIISILVFSLA